MDIFDILKNNGYDIDNISEELCDDLEQSFDEEKDNFFDMYIEKHQKIIALEFAERFNIKKKG